MSDESKQQEQTPSRRPMTDPRLERQAEPMTVIQRLASWAGWVAALLLIAGLFWLAIVSKLSPGPMIVLGAAVVLAVFWGIVHRGVITGVAGTRGVRLGTNSVIFVLFMLGCLILVNVIAARHHWREDLTEAQKFSLSQQTRQVVGDLEQDVTILGFINPGPSEIANRLREYNMLSPKVKVQTYDPQMDVEKVEEYDIMSPNTVVVESGDKQEKVYGGDEEGITSAILAATSGEKTRIYFLTGHGERSPEDTGRKGIRTIRDALQSQQYEVETLNLATMQEPTVPGDCAVLVIAGPTEPLRQEEIDAIVSYAGQNGKLLVALEPGGPDLASLLDPYGVTPRGGTVHDPSYGLFGRSSIPVVADYQQHRITQDLTRQIIAMPTARALEVTDESMQQPMQPGMPPPPQKAQPLLKTSPDATIVEGTEGGASMPGGPYVLAAAVDTGQTQPDPYGMQPEQSGDEGVRMVVLGDADMMTEERIQQGLVGNAYFVLNSINWLVENEKLISIPPKQDMPNVLNLNDRQQKFIWVLTVGIIPLAIGIAGFAVWWRRR